MNIINDPDNPNTTPVKETPKRFYLTGCALVAAGIIYFLDRNGNINLNFDFFGWELILILVGIFVGERSNFIGFSWLILIGIGVYFKLDEFFPNYNLRLYYGPLAFILLGAYFLFVPKFHSRKARNRNNYRESIERGFAADNALADDYIDVVSIFGGVNKNVISKQFKGGDATSIFGGTELNLMQSDFEGSVKLELTQIFGGCTLIIPPHWDLKTEFVNIFGGVEDNRPTHNVTVDTNKVLLLKGTSVFGGIEIKSY